VLRKTPAGTGGRAARGARGLNCDGLRAAGGGYGAGRIGTLADMTKTADNERAIPMPSPTEVERAIRLSYVQMMCGAVFFASTGGMFLVGFAMRLGADDVLLGLINTVPQFFVVFQFVAAALVERGWSRRRLTIAAALVMPLCWLLIAAIPFFQEELGHAGRFAVLMGVMAMAMVANQFAANARGSWLGELIPAARRGRFFGYGAMFGGIVGAIFAIAEGGFLDCVKSGGLLAFTALFFFGSVFGLAGAALNIPQPDCPLPGGGGARPRFLRQLADVTRNRPLVTLAIVHAVLAMGNVAAPFGPAYLLRDVHVSFVGLGIVNLVFVAAWLLSSPFWGRFVDRFGARPILTLGLAMMAPTGLVWLGIPPGEPVLAYCLLPWTNLICGVGAAAMNVAINTMVYKASKPEGRSVQFAAYGVFIGVVSAPMPLAGGLLVSTLQAAGYAVDLRITFYLWIALVGLAAVLSRGLREPHAVTARSLVLGYFPGRLAAQLGANVAAAIGWPALADKFQPGPPPGDDDPPKPGETA